MDQARSMRASPLNRAELSFAQFVQPAGEVVHGWSHLQDGERSHGSSMLIRKLQHLAHVFKPVREAA